MTTIHSHFLPGRRSLALAALLAAAACGGGTVSGGPPAVILSGMALTPAAIRIAAGASQQLTATASYSDGSTSNVSATATWTTSAAAVATVGSSGLVSAAGAATAGQTATITATFQGRSNSATLTIGGGAVTLDGVAVAPVAATVAPGATQQLTATASYSDGSTSNVSATATWTSSATAVAPVGTSGLVSVAAAATAGQTATITATFQGLPGTATITIGGGGGGGGISLTPAGGDVRLGRSLQLVATLAAGGADVTRTATWSSSSTGTFTVTTAGMVSPVAGATAGQTATITAASGGTSGTATVTVAAAAPAIGPGHSGDPLIAQQWHLGNTGQDGFADTAGVAGFDINPGSAYAAGYRGAGVKVAVVDSGLEIAHEDLSANVVPGSHNFVDATNDPTTTATDGDHGTMVGGLIGAVQGNGKGGMGVAPGVGLNGYNLLAPGNTGTDAQLIASLGQSSANPTSADAWVFNQSFGLSTTQPVGEPQTVQDAYAAGATALRGGRGAIYVKSSGNGFRRFGTATCTAANDLGISCQNASMDPANSLPYNIVVGALNASGVKSSYSTAGSALWVSAPGGEFGLNASRLADPGAAPPSAFAPAMVTTDQTGCSAGQAQKPPPAGWETPSDFNAGGSPNQSCNYTNTMNGTSSAAPVTSGVVALMLEANPTLGWRDVKHILATTAERVDAANAGVTLAVGGGNYQAEQPWFQNSTGRWFHNWYGFGLVDAGAAVAAARGYAYGSLGTFVDSAWITSATLGTAIPDASATGASHSQTVTAALTVEAVQVNVALTHAFWGDVSVELTSPSGTRSVLFTAASGFNAHGGSGVLHLASNAFYGESSQGGWTLRVVDVGTEDEGTLDRWQIKISGH